MLLAGESYPLKSIQVEDGLSQNMVYCILQDSNDFIWFGTQDGLNRYDGSFKVFANDHSTGLENDAICSLAEDAHGISGPGRWKVCSYMTPTGSISAPQTLPLPWCVT